MLSFRIIKWNINFNILLFWIRINFHSDVHTKEINTNTDTNLNILNHCETTNKIKTIKITSTTSNKKDINKNLSLNNQVF